MGPRRTPGGIQVQAGFEPCSPITSPEDAEARGGKMTNEGA